jgi:hypothetical protein
VSRANLAFKIVPVPKGPSQVNFYFEPGSVQVMQKVLSVFSLIWIAVVIYMVVRLIVNPYRNLRPFKD